MSRYRGRRFKKIRRLGALPGLTSKRPKSRSDLQTQLRCGKRSQCRIHLEEKQKLRFHYGLTERQLLKYVHIAGKAKGSTGRVLLQLPEMRLDNIIFRLGMASTIPGARQIEDLETNKIATTVSIYEKSLQKEDLWCTSYHQFISGCTFDL